MHWNNHIEKASDIVTNASQCYATARTLYIAGKFFATTVVLLLV